MIRQSGMIRLSNLDQITSKSFDRVNFGKTNKEMIKINGEGIQSYGLTKDLELRVSLLNNI